MRALTALLLAASVAGCAVLLGSDPDTTSSTSEAGAADGGLEGGGPVTCKNCPPPSNPCVVPACTNDGQCVEIAKPSSAAVGGEDAGTCVERYCDRGQVLTRDAPTCTSGTSAGLCKQGACVVPPSCEGLELCGRERNESCCTSITVPAGSYLRRYDGYFGKDDRFPATVSSFKLDKFEVTVARWNKFIDAGGGKATPPAVGAGAHPKHPDSGWLTAWNGELDLLGKLPENSRWPASLNWYAAFAFCVFDGGRLPTETEWGYVAAGGAEQRIRPWSEPPDSVDVGPNDMVYQGFTSTRAEVGTSAGTGRWGHLDLLGNVAEWVHDQESDLSTVLVCDDCLFRNVTLTTSLTKGGSVFFGGWENVSRSSLQRRDSQFSNSDGFSWRGARCVRDL